MTDQPKEKEKTSVPRKRSPSYPSLDLKTAIEKARLVLDKTKGHAVPDELAVQHMGYKSNNSNGFRALASMLSFGLLESIGSGKDRKVRISEVGKRILADKRDLSPDRDKLIRESALRPEIHKSVWEYYKGDLPDKGVIETYLVLEREFNESAARDFVKELKDTLSFAKITGGDILSGDDSTGDGGLDPTNYGKTKPEKPMNQPKLQIRDYTIPITDGGTAILRVPVPLAKKDVDRIAQWLSLMEDALSFELSTNTDDKDEHNQNEA